MSSCVGICIASCHCNMINKIMKTFKQFLQEKESLQYNMEMWEVPIRRDTVLYMGDDVLRQINKNPLVRTAFHVTSPPFLENLILLQGSPRKTISATTRPTFSIFTNGVATKGKAMAYLEGEVLFSYYADLYTILDHKGNRYMELYNSNKLRNVIEAVNLAIQADAAKLVEQLFKPELDAGIEIGYIKGQSDSIQNMAFYTDRNDPRFRQLKNYIIQRMRAAHRDFWRRHFNDILEHLYTDNNNYVASASYDEILLSNIEIIAILSVGERPSFIPNRIAYYEYTDESDFNNFVRKYKTR